MSHNQTIEAVFKRHGFFVSRETLEKIDIYQRLLRKWQGAINLVGPTTLDDAAERHFLDSAQCLRYIPDMNIRLADMGSGAGFPGMVLAILGVADVHLIESDIRKATFLREVSRETNTKIGIHDRRVEDCRIENVDIITARALAPLKDLLGMALKLSTEGHSFSCLFMKGEKYGEEVVQAKKYYYFEEESFQSITDNSSKILKINNLNKK